jgi:Na+-driven multidrug efflux pump
VADTRTPLRIAVTANVLNVALEVFLVYGLHLGLLGSAWGTVAALGLWLAARAVLLGRRWRRRVGPGWSRPVGQNRTRPPSCMR